MAIAGGSRTWRMLRGFSTPSSGDDSSSSRAYPRVRSEDCEIDILCKRCRRHDRALYQPSLAIEILSAAASFTYGERSSYLPIIDVCGIFSLWFDKLCKKMFAGIGASKGEIPKHPQLIAPSSPSRIVVVFRDGLNYGPFISRE